MQITHLIDHIIHMNVYVQSQYIEPEPVHHVLTGSSYWVSLTRDVQKWHHHPRITWAPNQVLNSSDQSAFRILFCFISDLAFWLEFYLLCLFVCLFACLFVCLFILWVRLTNPTNIIATLSLDGWHIFLLLRNSQQHPDWPAVGYRSATSVHRHIPRARPTASADAQRGGSVPIGSEIGAHSSSPRRDIRRSEHRVQTDGVSKQINKQIDGVSKQINKQIDGVRQVNKQIKK